MRRLIRSTVKRVGIDRKEEEQVTSLEEEVKQEEEPPASPKRRCLGGAGGEVTIKVARASTLVTIQEEEKVRKGKTGDKVSQEKDDRKHGKRKVSVKGIDDMSVEELRSEMRMRRMTGYSKLKLLELRVKLKMEVNSQRSY